MCFEGPIRVEEKGRGCAGRENSQCRGLRVRSPGRRTIWGLLSCPGLSRDPARAWPACSFLSLSSSLPVGCLAPFVLFCCLSSSFLFLFPSFLGLVCAPYGRLPHPPGPPREAGEGCEGALSPTPQPDAGPQWGALCLPLGLCELVCARGCEPVSTPCGLGAPGVRTPLLATPGPLSYRAGVLTSWWVAGEVAW